MQRSSVFEYNYSNTKNNLLTTFLVNIFYVEIFWKDQTSFSRKQKINFFWFSKYVVAKRKCYKKEKY